MFFNLNHSVPLLHYPHHCSGLLSNLGQTTMWKSPKFGSPPDDPQTVSIENLMNGYHFLQGHQFQQIPSSNWLFKLYLPAVNLLCFYQLFIAPQRISTSYQTQGQ